MGHCTVLTCTFGYIIIIITDINSWRKWERKNKKELMYLVSPEWRQSLRSHTNTHRTHSCRWCLHESSAHCSNSSRVKPKQLMWDVVSTHFLAYVLMNWKDRISFLSLFNCWTCCPVRCNQYLERGLGQVTRLYLQVFVSQMLILSAQLNKS